MSNKEEIKKIMEKAKKVASADEKTLSAKKEDKKLTKEKTLEEENKPIEKKKEGRQAQPNKPSIEIQQLINIANQQNQRLDKIISFQEKAVEQVKTQMGNQSTQVNSAGEDSLTDEQKLAQLQAEQDQPQAEQGQQQIPGNVSPALAYLYAFNPAFKEIAATVRAAMGREKMEKGGSENIYESTGKQIMDTMLTKFIAQQTGGGDNWLEQFKTFLAMQNAVAAGLFNSLKLAGKGQAETVMSNLFEQPQSPETTSPSEDHIT